MCTGSNKLSLIALCHVYLNKVDAEKFAYLNKVRHDMGFTQKIGSGQFRDAVELNARMRTNPAFEFSLEPRKGYKLATFLIS